ncbi:MAG: outer membrane protein assembly factor BamA [Spirochaetales bacterium]
MPIRALVVFSIVLLLPSVLYAQDDDWFMDEPIRDITFSNLDSVSESELEGIVEPYIDEPFTDRRFNELQNRLFALDYFTDLVPEAVEPPEGDGVIIDFRVEERPAVSEIRFEGNRNVRANQLIDEIVTASGDLVTESSLRSDASAIEEYYRSEGYSRVEVDFELGDVDDSNQRRVTFEISEGSRTTIEEIRFSGNSFASAGSLRRTIESSEQSIFNSGVFREGNLERDREEIQRYYAERGYVDAEVVEIEEEVVDEEDDRERLRLTYFIEEGEQWVFGGFTFEGNEIFSDEQLRAATRMSEGSVLNRVRLEQDFDSVLDIYREGGYLFNEIDLEEERDRDENEIAYTVNIVERGRAHIENIRIQGNDKTADEVILREVPLEEGDVFSLTRLREGLRNLANTQFFTNVQHDIPEGTAPGLLDLVLTVEEAPTTDLTFGLSFGGGGTSADGFPVSGQIGWQDRNFQGEGQTVGLELNAAPGNQRLSLNFQERWFRDIPWTVGGDISVDRNVRSNEPQDVLDPIGSGVPDPFTGEYVFTEETDHDGETYEAGEPFPGTPSEEELDDDDLNLATDYEEAGGRSAIPDEYLMEYTEWDVGLGLNTSRRFRTPYGELELGTDGRTSVTYLTYDDDTYRPFNSEIRSNLRDWRFVNRLGFNAQLDSRDLFFSPSTGGLARQDVRFVGGPLGGTRHYIRTDTRLEQFYTLWDRPVFENWNWKGVLAAHTSLGVQFPTFYRWGDGDLFDPGTDAIRIDGATSARGWPSAAGEARWNNWIELRQPLSEDIVWFDTFADAVALYDDRSDIFETQRQDFLFTLGAGFRFTVPQFPIRLYLGKRFAIDDDGQVDWQEGNLFQREGEQGSGLDFIFSLGTEFF